MAGVRLSKDEFLEKCKLNPNFNNYDFTNTIYINSRTDVEIICKLHGIFSCNAMSVMEGFGCNLCDKEHYPKTNLNLEEYKIFAGKLHNQKYDYSLVNNLEEEKITIICPDHGKFLIRRSAHISPKQLYGCQKCSRGYSKFEQRIEVFLKINNIEYEHQKKFEDLVGTSGQLLAFDFYLPNKNLLIEFDGAHHYHKVKFGKGQSNESQENKLEQVKRNDRIKNIYSFEKGIDLIRISYHREKDIEEILSRELLGIVKDKKCDSPWIVYRTDDQGKELPGKHIDYSYR